MPERDVALGVRTRIVVGLLTVSTVALTACGKSSTPPSPAAAVRQSFEQLRRAVTDRNVQATCALVAPAGADALPISEAAQALPAYAKDCEHGFGRRGEFESMSKGLEGLAPGPVAMAAGLNSRYPAPDDRPGRLASSSWQTGGGSRSKHDDLWLGDRGADGTVGGDHGACRPGRRIALDGCRSGAQLGEARASRHDLQLVG